MATIILPALCATMAQIVFVALAMAPENMKGFFASLGKWDGRWYMNIAEFGYHSPVPPVGQHVEISNVVFFPGYPFFVRLVSAVSGTEYITALAIAAMIACCGCWIYFFLLCREWKVGRTLTLIGSGLILTYPGAYFLVVGQSESLFLFFLLGYVYWSERNRTLLAIAHGFGASATRLVGMATAVYPLASRQWRPVRLWVRRVCVALMAALGGVLFFVFCRVKFGAWDLYMQTEKIGWGVTPAPFAILNPDLYRISAWPLWKGYDLDAVGWNRLFIPFCAVLLLATTVCSLAGIFFRKHPRAPGTSGLILVSWLMFAISLSRPENFLRFSVPIYVLQILAGLWLTGNARGRAWILVPLIPLCVAFLILQTVMAYRFGQESPI